jgi:hypothetical protein
MIDPVDAYRCAANIVAGASPTREGVLEALAALQTVRTDLDRIERELIASAREREVRWPDIAAALGLASRQAAEQRWLRLQGDTSRDPVRVRSSRREQRVVDSVHGAPVAELRRAARQAYRLIEADPGWDSRHSRAALARTSLQAAVAAPPSALYALCQNAIDDLDLIWAARLPAPLAAAVRRLRQAERAARPDR